MVFLADLCQLELVSALPGSPNAAQIVQGLAVFAAKAKASELPGSSAHAHAKPCYEGRPLQVREACKCRRKTKGQTHET